MYTFANGDRYEGEFKADRMHGRGAYASADGAFVASLFKRSAPVGVGAKWSADRASARRVRDGADEERIALDAAAAIAAELGLAPPDAPAAAPAADEVRGATAT